MNTAKGRLSSSSICRSRGSRSSGAGGTRRSWRRRSSSRTVLSPCQVRCSPSMARSPSAKSWARSSFSECCRTRLVLALLGGRYSSSTAFPSPFSSCVSADTSQLYVPPQKFRPAILHILAILYGLEVLSVNSASPHPSICSTPCRDDQPSTRSETDTKVASLIPSGTR